MCVRAVQALTAVLLVAPVLAVWNTVAPGVLLQDAGTAAALVGDPRAAGLWSTHTDTQGLVFLGDNLHTNTEFHFFSHVW